VKRVSRRSALAALPEGLGARVQQILRVAERRRLPIYLVGGPVRDLLLGLRLRDVDLVVEPRRGRGAAELASDLGADLGRITVHERFGTVSLATPDGVIDLATARREHYAHAGALPTVEASSLQEDLLRRDFSVNALAVPLAANTAASLVDPTGGVADLAARRLRILHERSFHDDPTRSVRGARLAARLHFRLERGTRLALRASLREGCLAAVSGERMRRELEKLFADAALGQCPGRALGWLADWQVLAGLEPGLTLESAALPPLRRLGRSWREPPWPRGRVRAWVPGLAVWLAPLSKGLRQRALARLALRGEMAERLVGFPAARDRWLRAVQRARSRSAIDHVLSELDHDMLLALHASVAAPLRRRVVRYAREDRPRRSLLGGHDLVALGLAGPAVGQALARVRAAHLDGRIHTRPEALALARELARG